MCYHAQYIIITDQYSMCMNCTLYLNTIGLLAVPASTHAVWFIFTVAGAWQCLTTKYGHLLGRDPGLPRPRAVWLAVQCLWLKLPLRIFSGCKLSHSVWSIDAVKCRVLISGFSFLRTSDHTKWNLIRNWTNVFCDKGFTLCGLVRRAYWVEYYMKAVLTET